MEKIKINSIEKKVSKMGQPFWVVKYNENGNATIGAWDAQFADYIEKDVGIGGTVSVVITQKGEYTNITEVDTTSGVKGECPNAQSETVVKQPTDRDSSLVAHLFDEQNDAVKKILAMAIKGANTNKKKIGICGQAPSDYPDLVQFLIEQGINSISLNPDTVLKEFMMLAK